MDLIRTVHAVEAQGVFKSFGDTQALNGANLVADPGEIHAVIGENGSGKSTLVKVIGGVLKPDRGSASILGSPAGRMGPRETLARGVATDFQEILVVERGTIAENVFLGMDGLFRRHHADKERVTRDLLSRLTGEDLDPRTTVADLPLSTKQMITIARALVRNPRVLILDESTAALDRAAAERVFVELDRLRQDGVCILLVTHRIAELSSFADRATVLVDGTTVAALENVDIDERRLLSLMTGEAQEAGGERHISRPDRERPGPVVLRCEGLQLEPGTKPFDFQLQKGEVVGVGGLEGHGQKEFARILAGIASPAAGKVTVVVGGTERQYSNSREAGRCGIVYVSGDRNTGVFPGLSILENFGMPNYRKYGIAGLVNFRRTSNAFEPFKDRLSIQMRRSRDLITTLSGGNQQKVMLARWLAFDPTIVILNDPTRGVDIHTKHDLYQVLIEIVGEGRAIFFLSSEIEEFEGLCDRVVVFRDKTPFRDVPRDEISPGNVLAAMFGSETGARPINSVPRHVSQ